MKLMEICKNYAEFLDANKRNKIIIRDDDGDKFLLCCGKSNRIAIQSLNNRIIPVIYGDVSYEVIEKTEYFE